MHRTLVTLSLLALIASCDRPQPPDARELAARALRGTLSYPHSTLVSISTGTDAAEATLVTDDAPERVARWFRDMLPMNGWQLRNEGKGAAGAVTIYAEKAGRPLWLTLKPNAGGAGTIYTMNGVFAEPDSTAATIPGTRP